MRWAEPLPTKRQSSSRSRLSSSLVASPRVDMNVLLARLKASLDSRHLELLSSSLHHPTPVPFMFLRIPRPPSLPSLPSPVPLMSLRISCLFYPQPRLLLNLPLSWLPMASSSPASQFSAFTHFLSINIPFSPDLVETFSSSPLAPSARARVCKVCSRVDHGTLGCQLCVEDWPRPPREQQ